MCNTPLIWGCDFDYEDYGIDEEGIVSSCTCANNSCKVKEIEIYRSL